jgi:hypothetical protein
MKAGLAGDRGLSRVNAPHSKEVFRATIRGMPNGSAPGGSGISYAELKCMSGGALNLLSDLCNVSVAAGLPPTGWCKEIVYMIPKEAGVDVIEKQRPLELQEPLSPRRWHAPCRSTNYQGMATAQWGSWWRRHPPPPERPLSSPEPLRCLLGPWSAPAAPACPPPRPRPTAAARPQRGLPAPRWTRLSSSRLPRGGGGLGVAPVGVWGGLGGTNPFSRRISTLSRKLATSPPARTHRARSVLQADLIRGACLAVYI